jgi:hypothetical protein
MFCVVSFTVGPVAATEPGLPNQHSILIPSKHRMVVMGIPEDATRTWMNEWIPNGNGGIMALCLKYIFAQQVFPANAPALGGSMFCLANLTVVTPFQSSADIHIFTRDTPGRELNHRICNDALILAENTTTTGIQKTVTISCRTDEGGANHLIGFRTTSNGPAAGTAVGEWDDFVTLIVKSVNEED